MSIFIITCTTTTGISRGIMAKSKEVPGINCPENTIPNIIEKGAEAAVTDRGTTAGKEEGISFYFDEML